VIASAHLMAVLDTTVMFVALPSAQRALGLSVSTRQWVLTAYTLALAGLLLLGGRLADRLGARRTLLIGVAGFALASAVGGASADGAMLIAARAGQFGSSIGAALLNTVAATAAAGYLAAHAGGEHRDRQCARLRRRHGLGRGPAARRSDPHQHPRQRWRSSHETRRQVPGRGGTATRVSG
jgi:MFS family permease